MTTDLNELQRMPQELAEEENVPCIKEAAAAVPTAGTFC